MVSSACCSSESCRAQGELTLQAHHTADSSSRSPPRRRSLNSQPRAPAAAGTGTLRPQDDAPTQSNARWLGERTPALHQLQQQDLLADEDDAPSDPKTPAQWSQVLEQLPSGWSEERQGKQADARHRDSHCTSSSYVGAFVSHVGCCTSPTACTDEAHGSGHPGSA